MARPAAILWVLMTALLLLAPGAATAQTSQDSVKATFLYRFASFVTWPPATFADTQTPIRICVIGAEPFGQLVERSVAGQRIDGRAFEVRRLASPSGARECHVLYAAGERAAEALRSVHGLPVLTVTDAASGRGGERGMIHFVIVDDRVRFHIDDARAAESTLFISSRLLSLAVSVRRRAGS